MKISVIRSILCALLLLPLVARAADDASAIAPYIDQNTLFVMRLDTTSLDIPAVGQWLTDGMNAAGDPAQNPPAAQVAESTQTWLNDFHKAGGSTLFFFGGLQQANQAPAFYLAPLPPGSDSKAVEAALARLPGAETTRVINNAVFAADSASLDALQNFKPAPRPELAQALADAGTAPFKIAIIPSDDVRRVFEALAPQIPPSMGGGPLTIITHGIHTGSVSIDPRPAGKMQIHFQSTDASAATDMAARIDAAAAALRSQANQPALAWISKLADQIKPRVDGANINLDFSADGEQLVAGSMLSSVLRARDSAMRVKDMSNIRQLMIACIQYGNKHQQQWPNSLDDLVKDNILPQATLISPRNPLRKPSYVYVKPAQPYGKVDPNAIVIYDAQDGWNQGLNAGMADGHIEWMSNEGTFKKQLALTTQPAPQ